MISSMKINLLPLKIRDLKFDFSDNMSVLNDYNGIGFDFETEDLGFPCS